MQKTLLDLGSQAFDLYFAREIEKITPEAKDALPRDIVFKMFRRGGEWNAKSTSRLSFLTKMFVLLRALKKRFFLIIEDEKDGISPEQFAQILALAKDRDDSMEAAGKLILTGQMILANKELTNTFQYLNFLNTSPAYNYLLRNKNVPENKYDKADREMAYIVRFLTFWETNRKDMVANTGVSIPELYVLLSLFDGNFTNTAFIYNDKFKRAYQSSPRRIKKAFGVLQDKKYIAKIGEGKGSKMQITALGKDTLKEILRKYAINC